jgi:C-terminal processing protease CtpA/Prc
MSRFLSGAAVALLVATSAWAGSGSKCTRSTQECLDYMATKMKDSGWVGVELEGDDVKYGPMTVVKIIDGSPAQKAGIQPGDILVAINGIPLEEGNQEKLASARAASKPGQSVTWTMRREGEKRDVTITLAAMPADVLARYIGQHMLEHVTAEAAASK